jgi:bifunctional non-homologous end joining protein LigD
MPGYIPPQLAPLKFKAPVGSKWLHEIKYDGYRRQIHLNKGVRIFTRNGHDWTNHFPIIAGAMDIPVERAIFDGEVVVVHEGRTNFSELQADLASGKQIRLVFHALDLLVLRQSSFKRLKRAWFWHNPRTLRSRRFRATLRTNLIESGR